MLRNDSRLKFNIFVFFFFFFWFLGRCVSGKISLPNNIKLNRNRNEERGTNLLNFIFVPSSYISWNVIHLHDCGRDNFIFIIYRSNRRKGSIILNVRIFSLFVPSITVYRFCGTSIYIFYSMSQFSFLRMITSENKCSFCPANFLWQMESCLSRGTN